MPPIAMRAHPIELNPERPDPAAIGKVFAPMGTFRRNQKRGALARLRGMRFHLDVEAECSDRKIVGQTPSTRWGRAAGDLGLAGNQRPMDRSRRRGVGERKRGAAPPPKHDGWRQPATLRRGLVAGENLDDPAQNMSIDGARKPASIDIVRLDTPFGRKFG